MKNNEPKPEKTKILLRRDLADRLPKEKDARDTFINLAIEHELAGINAAASIMGKRGGSKSSEKKTLAARENAKKPRPRIAKEKDSLTTDRITDN